MSPRRRSSARLGVACGVLVLKAASAASDDVIFRDGFECAVLTLANTGCEFYAVPLANTLLPPSFAFAVALTNSTARDARAVISGGALGVPAVVTVPPGDASIVALPWVNALQTTSATVKVDDGAYRILSDGPLAASQFSPFAYLQGLDPAGTVDASLLLPTHALTGNYDVVTWPSWQDFPGYFAVVATADNTSVNILTTAVTKAGGGVSTVPGIVSNVTLHRGDVLQVLAETPGSGSAHDLTGSVITASNPVAVFGGHDLTQLPDGSFYADHLEEQLPPAETLGMDFILAVPRHPIGPSKHFVKVVGTEDGTTISYAPSTPPSAPLTLSAQQAVLFEATQDFRMTSTHAMIVSQYLESGDRYGAGGNVVGDPSMGMVVPLAQFRSDYMFVTPTTFPETWLTIVAPTGTAVTLDGVPVAPASFLAVTGTPYAVARVQPSATTVHRLSAAVPVGVYVYGYGDGASYLLPAGMALQIPP